ncbi:MAG TPA: MerR family transcriptional regulator [Holophagaceae bacterium]|nr:MerR family transcriptional regulator [Holophagaceae bacterium]
MEKRWFKIGECAERLGVTPKELRYWETIVPDIKPRRSQGNLRYYHLDQFETLIKIRDWLKEGLTVADCRQLLRTGTLERPLDLGLDEADLTPARAKERIPRVIRASQDLKPVLQALKRLRDRLASPPILP